ncbi:MAG: cell division protein SepF [Tissierellia bacterium]|nr:cell division protein SepF [Tissierellia bacterium]
MGDLFNKFKYFIGIDDYEEEYTIDEDDSFDTIEPPISSKRIGGKVVNLHTNSNMKIVVHEPLSYEEAPAIIDDLKLKKAVVVNFEQLDTTVKRQIFDFINGGLYAVEGKIQKVTRDIFILAPLNIEIDGLKDELKNRGIFPW